MQRAWPIERGVLSSSISSWMHLELSPHRFLLLQHLLSVDSEPRIQISRAQGPRLGNHRRPLGTLEALIRKETANDSVSGLWQLPCLYGPFTALWAPGVQTVPCFVREDGAKAGAITGSCGPRDPPSPGAGSFLTWLRATLTGQRSLGSASWS